MPAGTAGAPMLEVLIRRELTDTVQVVVGDEFLRRPADQTGGSVEPVAGDPSGSGHAVTPRCSTP